MKKLFISIRDSIIAGIIFLLPIIILFVVVSKVFYFFTGFTNKLAAVFGLKSFIGISGGTIIGTIGFLLLCLVCGYLVKVAFFKQFNKWIEDKMAKYIPGYQTYREMALSKIEPKDEVLPYTSAAWLRKDGLMQPCFIESATSNYRLVVFVPQAGNVKEGAVL
jgi:hypothetical protein